MHLSFTWVVPSVQKKIYSTKIFVKILSVRQNVRGCFTVELDRVDIIYIIQLHSIWPYALNEHQRKKF